MFIIGNILLLLDVNWRVWRCIVLQQQTTIGVEYFTSHLTNSITRLQHILVELFRDVSHIWIMSSLMIFLKLHSLISMPF